MSGVSHMERTNFALRLLPSLLKNAQRIAEREECSVNQLINVALAEKLSVLDAQYWEERKRNGNPARAIELLDQLGGNEAPREGDEIPEGFDRAKLRRQPRSRATTTPKALTAGGGD